MYFATSKDGTEVSHQIRTRYSLESEANDDNILYSDNCLLEGIDVLEVPNTFKEFIDIMKDL